MELSHYCSRFANNSDKKNCHEEAKSAKPVEDRTMPRKQLLTLITFIFFDIAGVSIRDMTIHGTSPALALGLPSPMSVHDRTGYHLLVQTCWIKILGQNSNFADFFGSYFNHSSFCIFFSLLFNFLFLIYINFFLF